MTILHMLLEHNAKQRPTLPPHVAPSTQSVDLLGARVLPGAQRHPGLHRRRQERQCPPHLALCRTNPRSLCRPSNHGRRRANHQLHLRGAITRAPKPFHGKNTQATHDPHGVHAGHHHQPPTRSHGVPLSRRYQLRVCRGRQLGCLACAGRLPAGDLGRASFSGGYDRCACRRAGGGSDSGGSDHGSGGRGGGRRRGRRGGGDCKLLGRASEGSPRASHAGLQEQSAEARCWLYRGWPRLPDITPHRRRVRCPRHTLASASITQVLQDTHGRGPGHGRVDRRDDREVDAEMTASRGWWDLHQNG
mmetsp:Transcript_56852/g.124723  ORF Transcript_56852/g.124723 Transcript_56852/m.124723 type:complete len:304 (-) Transcript_56852:239-1150(-)